MVKSPKIISALLCEDIRQELSGKFSLAGVFGSGMNVPSIPATFIVGLFAEVLFSETGEFEPEFRVVDAADSPSITGKLKLAVLNLESAPIILGPLPVTVSRAGDVKIQWRFAGSDWQTMKAFKVSQAPVAPANLSTMPPA